MDLLLTILGILALGAVCISAFVFVAAAKRHIHANDLGSEYLAMDLVHQGNVPDASIHTNDLQPAHRRNRSRDDRRRNTQMPSFPATIGGVLVAAERRTAGDRRRV